MTDQPKDYAPFDGHRATLHRGEPVIPRIQGVTERLGRLLGRRASSIAWLGFWLALAILGSSAMWAWVVDRDSEREYFVRSMQVLQDATARGSRL